MATSDAASEDRGELVHNNTLIITATTVLYTSEREGDDEKGAGIESRPFKTILQVRACTNAVLACLVVIFHASK